MLRSQCDESNMQFAAKVVGKTTVVVMDAEERRTNLTDS